MEQIPVQSGIYAITHKGQTAFYVTEKFGNLRDVLPLLHQVHAAKELHPDSPLSEADRLLQYSKSMVPICASQGLRLFQPLEREEYDFVLGEIKGGGEGTAHYRLNYDEDQFSVTIWERGELKTASASLQSMIAATGAAFIKRSGEQTYFSQKALIASLSEIMTISLAPTGPDEPQPTADTELDGRGQEDMPLDGPTGFAGPSM